ncbi:MAG TPA: DUF2237 domain-containing protein [Flavobacteriales bacterium]|jgi:uncharacterized protein (DUF2237 family)|nr:DUF2237 domain-containing protein [Flavobacteriales bacterium]
MELNVFGEPLLECSNEPLTGFYRDGCCHSGPDDLGVHTVCVIVTKDFLDFSKQVGNDLSTPRPQWSFPGLKPGDRWCLCASRFKQAAEFGYAPKVVLEATNEKTLKVVDMSILIEHAHYTKEHTDI